jgi:uncharacterized protein GlcG (DUF336 family)
MKTDDAKRMMEAARAKAAEIGKPVTIAIVDAGGALMMLERLSNAGPISAITAEGKAVGSALTGRTSAQLMEAARNGSPMIAMVTSRAPGRFMPQQGAVPVTADGEVVGAVGVGGALSEEDEQIAMAAAAAYAK